MELTCVTSVTMTTGITGEKGILARVRQVNLTRIRSQSENVLILNFKIHEIRAV